MNMFLKDRKDLSDREIEQIMNLLLATWPPQDKNVDIEKMIMGFKNDKLNAFSKVILYYNNEELIGHTEIFNREIVVEGEKQQILALAGVCVNTLFRGKNIGQQIVKKAFEYVDNGQFTCSIFQTNVPEFYEKINCKKINNTFINSKNKTDININPWRDPNVMVYPKSYNTGGGLIDLNGDGY